MRARGKLWVAGVYEDPQEAYSLCYYRKFESWDPGRGMTMAEGDDSPSQRETWA